MVMVFARIQASEQTYKDRISNELDEYKQGLTFDFKKSENDDNIISVEYDNKLIALVEKQGNDYMIERITGTPQANKLTQAIEHGREWLEKHFNLSTDELTFKEQELEDVKGRINLEKNIIYLNPLYKGEYNKIIEHELLHYALYTQGLEYRDDTSNFNTFARALGVDLGYVGAGVVGTHEAHIVNSLPKETIVNSLPKKAIVSYPPKDTIVNSLPSKNNVIEIKFG